MFRQREEKEEHKAEDRLVSNQHTGSKKTHQEVCPFALATRRRFFAEVISLKTHDARGIKLDEDSDS